MNAYNSNERLRLIPGVDQLLERPAIAFWVQRVSREFVVSEIQAHLKKLRESILSGAECCDADLQPDTLESSIISNIRDRLRPKLRTVVNATGVILHTNLGRAPLSKQAQDNLSALSGHYTNLEYDIDAGKRSHRDKILESTLREILGCESALVVNNNAAAVFMILNTLASGKEVIVSRGELVEIGGSFRIPDILARSGARLREVGTTNKTRLQDYEKAIGSDTAMLLRVHPSNFRIRGFTDKPDLQEMAGLAHKIGIPLIEDVGSGCLVNLRSYGIPDEPVVRDSLKAGADLVCFSGDKLLGGPQAGIIAGAHALVEPIRHNPLMRTYRVDKLRYAALEATLASYRSGREESEIPIIRMMSMTEGELRKRLQRFRRRLTSRLPANVRTKICEGSSVVGGGSCPDCPLPTTLLAIESDLQSPNNIESRLRLQERSIIVRLEEDKVLVDLRTVFPEEEPVLIEGILKAVASNQ